VATRATKETSSRDQLLNATRQVLARDGAAALSVRSVAVAAGINQSLIHYYFGSRDGLLLAVLERMNSELLERQHRMYGRTEMTLSEKWLQAVAFYREDLASGYVRILLELCAHGYSNPEVAKAARATIAGWRDLLADVATEAIERLHLRGVRPEVVSAALVSFWYGMEAQHLLEVPEEEGHLWETLDAIGDAIAKLEGEGG
jgi:AcrR family transcriptional regulator